MPEDINAKIWEARCKEEQRRADANLRLAAERATEIGELREQNAQLRRDLADAQADAVREAQRGDAAAINLQILQERAAALIAHLEAYTDLNRDMAIVQEVWMLIPKEAAA